MQLGHFTLTFFISIFTLSFTLQGQTADPSTPGGDEVLLKGRLVQEASEKPLPYATVAVFNPADSSVVSNAMSLESGAFRMQVPAGNYYAVITYVGYEDKTLRSLAIPADRDSVNLGRISMATDAVALDAVEVQGERSQMELKLDRRVFNVGKDLTNAGYNAADILDNVPSVTVDTEGNVSLRGSQGVRILVNGKPSGLLSSGDTEALLRMQGDMIASIEVITNPSARYEAEGEAGIINIILKKNEEKGVNGSFGATLGHPHNYGASYSLNFRRQKLNFFSNFGLNFRQSPGGGFSTRQFFDGNTLDQYYTTETDQVRGGLGGDLQVGADWFLDERNTLTGSVLLRRGKDDNDATLTYRDLDGEGNVLERTVRETEEVENEQNIEANLRYERAFAHPDQKWTVDFKYILDDETELADYAQTSTGLSDPLIQRSSNTEDEANMLLQTDYLHPLGENARVETGLRAAMRTVNNDYLVEEENESGVYVPLPEFDDHLKYTENIYAAYAIAALEFGSLGLQAGLRAELSDISAALLESQVENEQHYFNLFPSASLSYSFSEQDQWQLSYSKRLSRPHFRALLPFSNFNDPRNNNVGNPNLRPEFSDSYETGYLHYFSTGSLLASVYYRHTTGVIEDLILPGEDGTSIEYPTNLSSRNAYGVELNFNYGLTSWWEVNTDLNFFRAIVDGAYEGIDYSSDTYSWYGRFTTKAEIGRDWQLQSSFRYRGPRNTAQGRRLASYSLDMGLAVDVFSGKGTITLTGRDLLNTRKRRSIVDLPEYKSASEFQWRQARQLVLRLSYRLNQDKRPEEQLNGEMDEGNF